MPTTSPTKARPMPVRFGLTAADQCVSSLSNFVVGVAAARLAGIEAFGAYSLVYSLWLVVAAFHRSLVTDPMAIENDLHRADRAAHLRLGLAAELWLGIGAAAVFTAGGGLLLTLGQRTFGACFLSLAPWLPCLVAQDYWRWAGFMSGRPGSALANDVVFDGAQAATFAALALVGARSSTVAIDAWGAGAACGALFGLRQFRVRLSLRGGLGRIRLRWTLSRWLVADNATSSASSQAAPVLTGAFLGPAGVGGLKAAAGLVYGPALVLVQAGGSIGLPEASRALLERGWPGLRRVQRWVTAAGMTSVGVVAVVVFCFGRRLLEAVYGPSFGRFAGIADILAVSTFCSTAGLGAILCLKATKRTRRLFVVSAFSLGVSVLAVAVLAAAFGLVGAAVAAAFGNAATTSGLLATHWTSTRRAAEAMSPASGTPGTAAAGLPGPGSPVASRQG